MVPLEIWQETQVGSLFLRLAGHDCVGRFERPEQAQHDGLLRRAKLTGTSCNQAIENGNRGEPGLVRQSALVFPA